jgi:hypothetical protein
MQGKLEKKKEMRIRELRKREKKASIRKERREKNQ